MTELRLYFRRYSRQHVSVNDFFDEVLAHYKPLSSEQTTYRIPVSPQEAHALREKGIVIVDAGDRDYSLVVELKICIPCTAGDADDIIQKDFGSPTYAELVKKYRLEREAE